MREIRPSGSEGGARFKPLSLPLSARWMRCDRRPATALREQLPDDVPVDIGEPPFNAVVIKAEALVIQA